MKRILQFIGIIMLTVGIVACSSKITQENFDKVTNNMTLEQVSALLGKPTKQTHVEIGALSGTAATWEHEKNIVSIQFIDKKVVYKNFSSNGVHKFEIKPGSPK